MALSRVPRPSYQPLTSWYSSLSAKSRLYSILARTSSSWASSVPEVASFHHASLDVFSPVPGAARKRRGNSLSRGQKPKLLLQDVCRRDDLTTEKGGSAAGASASMPPSRVVPAAIFRVPLTPVAPGVILPLPATSPPIRPSPLPCNLSWCSLSLCAPYDASLNHRAVAAKVIAARGPSDSVLVEGLDTTNFRE